MSCLKTPVTYFLNSRGLYSSRYYRTSCWMWNHALNTLHRFQWHSGHLSRNWRYHQQECLAQSSLEMLEVKSKSAGSRWHHSTWENTHLTHLFLHCRPYAERELSLFSRPRRPAWSLWIWGKTSGTSQETYRNLWNIGLRALNVCKFPL